jgi:hypothetical protein
VKPHRFQLLLVLSILVGLAQPALTQVDPSGRSILFVRGAAGSGGATEGGTFQQRTEQLSDIFNLQTSTGNHGWGMLALALTLDGFQVSQLVESAAPITTAQLVPHRIVVMGSNNKVYTPAEVAAFHAYIDQGGSALFISDANWGLTWEAAPASDNQFLGRYGAQVYQDSGQLPLMSRLEAGRFIDPGHAVLSGPDGVGGLGDVEDYDGEGVSLFQITTGSAGYQAAPVVSAQGLVARLNNAAGGAGNLIIAGASDCALFSVVKGDSRIVGHFDRNTFFNLNGAGTNIFHHDNSQLAMNVFRFLAAQQAEVIDLGGGCGTILPPLLLMTTPRLGTVSTLSFLSGVPNALTFLLASAPGAPPIPLGSGCAVHVAVPGYIELALPWTDATGAWVMSFALPNQHQFAGLTATVQAVVLNAGGPFLGVGELSNGLQIRLGF